MKHFLLLVLVLQLEGVSLRLVAARTEPGVTYYVKPSKTSKCPGQPCETLNDYLDNMASEINRRKNVTLLFLNGSHSLNDRAQSPQIMTSIFRMIGESENVNVVASELELNPSAYHFMLVGNNVATIQNLVAVNWKLMVLMNFDNLSPGIFNVTAAKMQNCWFETSYESHTQIYIEQSILQGG